MTRLYELLVCPQCRRQLTFVGNDEGMYVRALCCDRYWLRPDDSRAPDRAALRIHAVEARR